MPMEALGRLHPEPLLKCESVSASYGSLTVVRNVDLSVGPGEILAILGPNGAGKTSLLGRIVGRVKGTGSVEVHGTEVTGLPPRRIIRHGVALVPDDRGLFPDMSVKENLLLGARLASPGRQLELVERNRHLFPRLFDRLKQRAGMMSGGEQQMLAIAKCLASDPSVFLLDEPTQGLAPRVYRELRSALLSLRTEGLGVILVEQNYAFAATVADRYQVLAGGRVVEEGIAGQMMDREDIVKSYLGGP